MSMYLGRCRLIELPKISDPRGNLTFVEEHKHVPFPIARVYYLYDVPGGAERGGHAHKALDQLLIAVAGSFVVTLNDSAQQCDVRLNRATQGLHIPRMVWREIHDFSSGSVCLVLASHPYDESDYYRDFDAFAAAAQSESA